MNNFNGTQSTSNKFINKSQLKSCTGKIKRVLVEVKNTEHHNVHCILWQIDFN